MLNKWFLSELQAFLFANHHLSVTSSQLTPTDKKTLKISTFIAWYVFKIHSPDGNDAEGAAPDFITWLFYMFPATVDGCGRRRLAVILTEALSVWVEQQVPRRSTQWVLGVEGF